MLKLSCGRGEQKSDSHLCTPAHIQHVRPLSRHVFVVCIRQSAASRVIGGPSVEWSITHLGDGGLSNEDDAQERECRVVA